VTQQLGFNESPGPGMANAQWDEVKNRIIDLYKHQKIPLKDVMQEMSSSHGFVRK
jgi:hypothetical protein